MICVTALDRKRVKISDTPTHFPSSQLLTESLLLALVLISASARCFWSLMRPQHLSIECLETLRELLDQPPHCGLLFAGTHELEEIFTRQALELEQWRSRFHAGQALPGISEQEAANIVHSELGLGLSQRKIQKLILKSRINDLRNGGQHSYVSARRLFWVIRELQAVT